MYLAEFDWHKSSAASTIAAIHLHGCNPCLLCSERYDDLKCNSVSGSIFCFSPMNIMAFWCLIIRVFVLTFHPAVSRPHDAFTDIVPVPLSRSNLSPSMPAGSARRGAGPPLGGAGLPLRQVRGVRQRGRDDDAARDGRVAREPLQGHGDEGGEHRAVLPRAPVLPRLQADAAQRPVARADAAHGPHARRHLLPEGRPDGARQALPPRCTGAWASVRRPFMSSRVASARRRVCGGEMTYCRESSL